MFTFSRAAWAERVRDIALSADAVAEMAEDHGADRAGW